MTLSHEYRAQLRENLAIGEVILIHIRVRTPFESRRKGKYRHQMDQTISRKISSISPYNNLRSNSFPREYIQLEIIWMTAYASPKAW